MEHKEVKGFLWHINYLIEEGGGSVDALTVATTRPETLLGDSAVAVHPEDERYQHLIGKRVLLPLTDRSIPIIADKSVDKDFGSGAVKITPAHDFNDYEMGKRHKLEQINILNPNGTLNENGGSYQGLKILEAREQIVKDLTEKNLLSKIEPHAHSIGHCSRSGCVVEPYLSKQWFVNTAELSIPATRTVQSGTTTFEPAAWTKTYLHWMDNIQDWCISRQLWWGHRIPAWYCKDCEGVTVTESTPSSCSKCKGSSLYQDEDVLDTWFSSALWPMSTLGWPRRTASQETFYPMDILVTGHDIIFFWVARMMMMGLEFRRDVPFRKVYIHGLVRDAQGNKMSKSSNNSVDPVELIDDNGSDALRFTLLSQVASGKDLKFSKQRLEGYKNFMNKIWNAARFVLTFTEGDGETASSENLDSYLLKDSDRHKAARHLLSDTDRWVITKLGECEFEMDRALEQNRFADAAKTIYSFTWHEFCDWYLEFSKPTLYGEDREKKKVTEMVLMQTLSRLLRLLHPFAPFITEEIYQKIPIAGKSPSIMIDSYPNPTNDKDWLSLGSEESAQEIDLVKEVIAAIRNIRGENRIKPGEKIQAQLSPEDNKTQKILMMNKELIVTLAQLEDCRVESGGHSLSKCALTPIRMGERQVDVIIPLEGLVNFDEEIKRINKSINKCEKESFQWTRRLENEDFINNAPKDVVEQGRQQLENLQAQMKSLQDGLRRLS